MRHRENLRILELGAGRGNVTAEILRESWKNTEITALEYDLDRIKILEKLSQPHLTIIHGDVCDLDRLCTPESFDIVISTLPLGSFDPETVDIALKNIQKVLKKWGKYIQYQYWMANKKDIKKYFHIEKIRLEPRNFSPAFIYITRKH